MTETDRFLFFLRVKDWTIKIKGGYALVISAYEYLKQVLSYQNLAGC
jgi:hypothetical protein